MQEEMDRMNTVMETEKADKSELFSKDYRELTNTPEIPSIEGLATELYVDEKITDLIDFAPDAMNTLRELAESITDHQDVYEKYIESQVKLMETKADKTTVQADNEKMREDFNDALESEISECHTDLSNKITSLGATVEQQINTINTTVNERFEIVNDTIEEQISMVNNTVNEQISIVNNTVAQQFDMLSNTIDEQITMVNNNLNQQVDLLNREIDQQVELLNKEIDQQVELINKDIEQNVELINKDMEQIRKVDTRQDEYINVLFDRVEANRNDFLNADREIKTEFNDKIRNEVDTLNKRIDTEVNTINNYINEKITEEVDTLNKRVDTEVNVINERVNTVEINVNNRITEEVNNINNKIDEEIARIDNAHTEHLNVLYDKCEELKAAGEQETADRQAADEILRNDLNGKLSAEVTNIHNRMDEEVATINSRMDEEVNTINNRITDEIERLDKEHTEHLDALYGKCENLDILVNQEIADRQAADQELEASMTALLEEKTTNLHNELVEADRKVKNAMNVILTEEVTKINTRLQEEISKVNDIITGEAARLDAKDAEIEQAMADMQAAADAKHAEMEQAMVDMQTAADAKHAEMQATADAKHAEIEQAIADMQAAADAKHTEMEAAADAKHAEIEQAMVDMQTIADTKHAEMKAEINAEFQAMQAEADAKHVEIEQVIADMQVTADAKHAEIETEMEKLDTEHTEHIVTLYDKCDDLKSKIDEEEPYLADLAAYPTSKFLFACGQPMTVEPNVGQKYSTDHNEDAVAFIYRWADGFKTIMVDKETAAKTYLVGGYGHDKANVKRAIPQTNMFLKNVKIKGLVGGSYFEGMVGHVNMVAENCEFVNVIGAGWCGASLNGKATRMNVADDINIKLTNCKVSSALFGGPQGNGVADDVYVELNNCDIGWITAGGSNGMTRNAVVVMNGGNVKVAQSTNRGIVHKARFVMNGGNVEKLYFGGETEDASVNGLIEDAFVELNDGNVKEFCFGTNNGVEMAADEMKGSIIDCVVENGDVSMLEVKERPEEVVNYDDTELRAMIDTKADKVEVDQKFENKVDKIEGFGLADEAEMTRLANVDNYDDSELRELIDIQKPYLADVAAYPTSKFLFACGNPMTVEPNVDHKYDTEKDVDAVAFVYRWAEGFEAIVIDKAEAEKVYLVGGHGHDHVNVKRPIPQTNMLVRNVKIKGLVGGSYFEGMVGHVNMVAENCEFVSVLGGGWCGASVDGKTTRMNIADDVNIKMTNCKVSSTLFGGSQGNGVVDDMYMELNDCEIGWLTAGGSNGMTRNAEIVMNGGSIKVAQSTNRGIVHKARFVLINGVVNKLYFGGETEDSTVNGLIEDAFVELIGGEVKEFCFGTNNGIEMAADEMKGNIVSCNVVAGDVSMFEVFSMPENPNVGDCIFDEKLNRPIWFNGNNWVDAYGSTVR